METRSCNQRAFLLSLISSQISGLAPLLSSISISQFLGKTPSRAITPWSNSRRRQSHKRWPTGARNCHNVFPACEDARLDCDKPNVSNVDLSEPIRSWRTAWRRALKEAGLQIRFHDLRHCCVTKLAEGQASEGTIMSISGHLSRAMIEHYSHIRMAAKRAALDGIVKQNETTVFQVSVNQNVHQGGTPDSATTHN
jgi:integrase